MIYFPETINTISTLNTISTTSSLVSPKLVHTTHSVHAGIQKPWRSRLPQLSVVFSFCHVLSRPSSSLIWARLTLFVPATGFLAPLSQDGVPIHRVRAHTPPGVGYNVDLSCFDAGQSCVDVGQSCVRHPPISVTNRLLEHYIPWVCGPWWLGAGSVWGAWRKKKKLSFICKLPPAFPGE